MSRRDLPKTPPSLTEVKELEKDVKQKVSSAESRLSIVTNAIKEAETKKTRAEAELSSIYVDRGVKLAELAVMDGQISAAKDELRQVEGKVLAVQNEMATLLGATDKAKAENESALADLMKSHQERMAMYAKTQDELREVIAGVSQTIEKKEAELLSLNQKITAAKDNADKLESDVLPKLVEAKDKLEGLNRDVLLKEVELQNITEKHAEMVGKYNDEKTLYEEVNALRIKEEKRVEEELKKLFEKQIEVENKVRSLKVIQEGVDQATARLTRKEEELTLREHLFKQKEVTST